MLLTFTAAFILYIYFMSLLYLYLCLYIIWLRTEYYKLVLLLVEFNYLINVVYEVLNSSNNI